MPTAATRLPKGWSQKGSGKGKAAVYVHDATGEEVQFGFVGHWKGYYSSASGDGQRTKDLAWYTWDPKRQHMGPGFKSALKAMDYVDKRYADYGRNASVRRVAHRYLQRN